MAPQQLTRNRILCPDTVVVRVSEHQRKHLDGRNNILRDKSSFSKNREENSEVQHRTPPPMAGIEPVRKFEISPEKNNGETEQDLMKMSLSLPCHS